MTSKVLCSIVALLALSSSAACGDCDPDMTARGSASVAWSIVLLGPPATCARIGAASVSLRLHNRNGVDVTSSFPCTAGAGTTPLIAAGTYDATLTLHAADGATLATVPARAVVTISAGEVTALAPVTFSVESHGKLVLSFATLSTNTNCMPADRGGAGITGDLITVQSAAGGCAPITFVRSRGNISLGTYTVNCSSPKVVSCIERDEMLTVDNVEAGPYTISVTALVGPTRCWAGDDILSVPASRAALVKNIQLAPERAAGC